ncbi:MAG: HIRAN domain-containing protein [Clostridiales bacterium]|nr:HIRAN domain-containing protein [Clostridiales bacterium]
MDDNKYITINHLDDYMSANSLRVGMKLILKKDHDNPYDDEAIAVYTENGSKVGYVANSVQSVCRGTMSAGRIFDLFHEKVECIVSFIAVDDGFAIGKWLNTNEDNK